MSYLLCLQRHESIPVMHVCASVSGQHTARTLNILSCVCTLTCERAVHRPEYFPIFSITQSNAGVQINDNSCYIVSNKTLNILTQENSASIQDIQVCRWREALCTYTWLDSAVLFNNPFKKEIRNKAGPVCSLITEELGVKVKAL